jgi:hypothetical protein
VRINRDFDMMLTGNFGLLRAYAAHRLEQRPDLLARQRRGGLVNDEHPRLLPVPEGADDRDPGALGGTELRDRPANVEVVAQRAQALLGVPALGAPADAPAERGRDLAPERQVLERAENLDEPEVLVRATRRCAMRSRRAADRLAGQLDLGAGSGWG